MEMDPKMSKVNNISCDLQYPPCGLEDSEESIPQYPPSKVPMLSAASGNPIAGALAVTTRFGRFHGNLPGPHGSVRNRLDPGVIEGHPWHQQERARLLIP